jgi:hypothetical protein
MIVFMIILRGVIDSILNNGQSLCQISQSAVKWRAVNKIEYVLLA